MIVSATSLLPAHKGNIAQTTVQNNSIIMSAQMMQGGSTRPDRIPATLGGLQELNSKTLQELQQQLQAHLTAAHQELRAQVLLLAGSGGGGGWGRSRPGRCLVLLWLVLIAKFPAGTVAASAQRGNSMQHIIQIGYERQEGCRFCDSSSCRAL